VRIGRMIAYQEYNTKSPLNGLAAKWAAQHPELLPIDARTIAPPKNESIATAQGKSATVIPPPSSNESPSVAAEGGPTFLTITPDELGTAPDPTAT
jgi:hypothetical protein